MKLSEVKTALLAASEVQFELPDGSLVPEHFHVTEVGLIDKHFIDCGGVIRREKAVSFQLWNANDLDHRLKPQKLLSIIDLSQRVLQLPDGEVEVEYQSDTIGKYGLDFQNGKFRLLARQTACLASDNCGIPADKKKVSLSSLTPTDSNSCCTPGSGCC